MTDKCMLFSSEVFYLGRKNLIKHDNVNSKTIDLFMHNACKEKWYICPFHILSRMGLNLLNKLVDFFLHFTMLRVGKIKFLFQHLSPGAEGSLCLVESQMC